MITVNKKLKINNLGLLLYSFFNLFVIFRINLLVLPYYLYLFAIIGLIIAVIKFNIIFDRNFINSSIFYVVLLFIALVSCGVNNLQDISYISRLISIVYKFGLGAFSVYLFTVIFKQQATFNNFILSFSISCLLLLITSLILILLSDFSDFWIGNIVARNKLLDEGYFFRKSIIGYTGFDELTVYCVSYFCCVKIIADKMNSKRKSLKFWLLYIVLIFGGLIYGRTSIITAGLSLIFLFISVKNKGKLFNKLFILILLFIIGISFLYFVSLENDSVSSWFNWAFEPIIAFFNKSDIRSMNSWKRMIKIPDLKQFLFGDGRYTKEQGYYMDTDIGYLRDIYYFGVFGLICIYSFIFSFLKCINKNIATKEYRSFLVFVFLNIIILEIKGSMWDGAIIYLSMFYFISKYEQGATKSKEKRVANVKYKKNEVAIC